MFPAKNRFSILRYFFNPVGGIMSRIFILIIFVLILLSTSFFVSCGDDDDDDPSTSSGQADDDDTDDNSDDDNDDPWSPPTEVEFEKMFSPDEISVKVTFTQDIGDDLALAKDTYTLSGLSDEYLSTKAYIDVVEYDSESKTVTLFTHNKLMLGVTYELIMRPEGFNRTDGTCLAADTAKFWVVNYIGGDDYQVQITANRVGVGDTVVLYLEEGETITDVEKTLSEWKNKIYPIMVNAFGEPSDIDGNERVTVLGHYLGNSVGGYYYPLNLYPDSYIYDAYDIHSNEMELLHINTIDNSFAWDHTLPHEFQHLLYHIAHEDAMFSGDDWLYHNEGLSENAVVLVYGSNQRGIDYFLADYNGYIARGDSLIRWDSNYSDYANSFLFFAYFAGLGGGTDFLPDIFNLESGNPTNVTALIQFLLGASHDFYSMEMNWMIANWLQESSGQYSYNGYLSFASQAAPTAPSGTSSLNLRPSAGTYFKLSQSSVNYPGTQGANILYVGVDSQGNVDFDAPFDVDGGVLTVLNINEDYSHGATEPSGPDIAAIDKAFSVLPTDWVKVPRCWNDPPPVMPWQTHIMDKWKEQHLIREANWILHSK